MARIPVGIQLGKGVRPGFLRALDVLVAGMFVSVVWGAASLLGVRTELAAPGLSGPGGLPSSGTGGAAASLVEPERAREAAVLLFAGVVNAPDISAALDTVMGIAPSDVRIAGLEVRPATGSGRVEAVVAANATSAAAVARFLSGLADHDSVLSTEVISETRQTDGAVLVRITAQLKVGRP